MAQVIKPVRLLFALLAFLTCVSGAAQDYPAKAVRLVAGFPPGGNVDMVARVVAQKMSERFGQQMIVENRPGAGGLIGSDYVAKAPADGYTLLLVSGAYTGQAATMKTLPFDPVRDFTWISTLITYPFVLVVRSDSPFRTLNDLISAAKSSPGKLNFASVGIASVFHLATELFNAMAGIEITHVPFRGGAEPMTEVIAGRMDGVFETMPIALPHIQSGRVRALAVTSAERAPLLPETPTLGQTLPGYDVVSFSGIAAPRGTPGAIVERLNRDLRAVLELPDIRRRFTDLGGSLRASSPEEMGRYIENDIAKWKRVVEERKIVIQ